MSGIVFDRGARRDVLAHSREAGDIREEKRELARLAAQASLLAAGDHVAHEVDGHVASEGAQAGLHTIDPIADDADLLDEGGGRRLLR